MIRHTAFPQAVLATPQPTPHPKPSVKAKSIAYLIFERPDLDKAEQYLTDFGLIVTERSDDLLFLRGTNSAPYCYRVNEWKNPGLLALVCHC